MFDWLIALGVGAIVGLFPFLEVVWATRGTKPKDRPDIIRALRKRGGTKR